MDSHITIVLELIEGLDYVWSPHTPSSQNPWGLDARERTTNKILPWVRLGKRGNVSGSSTGVQVCLLIENTPSLSVSRSALSFHDVPGFFHLWTHSLSPLLLGQTTPPLVPRGRRACCRLDVRLTTPIVSPTCPLCFGVTGCGRERRKKAGEGSRSGWGRNRRDGPGPGGKRKRKRAWGEGPPPSPFALFFLKKLNNNN